MRRFVCGDSGEMSNLDGVNQPGQAVQKIELYRGENMSIPCG